MKNEELTYILNCCKSQLINSLDFKAIDNKQDAADYIEKNLNTMLASILKRESEIVAIFTSDTDNGHAMRDYLREMVTGKI